MYFGRDRDVKIKQLIAPAVPMWAEFEEPHGSYELPGCKARGWAEPVVALVLIEDYTNPKVGTLFDEKVEALVVNHNDVSEPIGPASAMGNFRGLSVMPPIRVAR